MVNGGKNIGHWTLNLGFGGLGMGHQALYHFLTVLNPRSSVFIRGKKDLRLEIW